MSQYLNICQDAIALAKKLGASDAACSVSFSDGMNVNAFEGKSSGVEGGSDQEMNIVVYVGKKSATAKTNILTKESIENSVKFAYQSALLMPEDEFSGLADASLIAKPTAAEIAALDLHDKSEHDMATLLSMAIEMENAARSVNGVTTIRGAEISQSISTSALVSSNGLALETTTTSRYGSVSAIAEKSDLSQIFGEYSAARHWSDVDNVVTLGQLAGQGAVDMLNVGKLGANGKVPVIFEKEIATKLLISNLFQCINGSAISNDASFVTKGDLGSQLFGKNVTLMDNRMKVRGLSSSICSGQGIQGPAEATIIKDGCLEELLLNVRSAKKLGLSPALGRPTLYNAYFAPGDKSKAGLAAGVKLGLYVTDVMGHGFNAVNGNVSYTVSGYAIRDGYITNEYVMGATMAGNIKDMLNHVEFANDLEFKRGANCSTALVHGLTLSS